MKDEENIKGQAAEMLLDIGIDIPLLPKFLFRNKNATVTIHRPTIGNLMRIALVYQRIGVTPDDLKSMSFDDQMKLAAEKGKDISLLVAYAVCSGCFTGKWLNGIVAWWLRWRVHPVMLVQAMLQLLKGTHLKSFCSIIPLAAQADELLSPIGSHTERMS